MMFTRLLNNNLSCGFQSDDHCGDDMNVVDEHEVEDSANVDRYLGFVIRDLSGKEPTS